MGWATLPPPQSHGPPHVWVPILCKTGFLSAGRGWPQTTNIDTWIRGHGGHGYNGQPSNKLYLPVSSGTGSVWHSPPFDDEQKLRTTTRLKGISNRKDWDRRTKKKHTQKTNHRPTNQSTKDASQKVHLENKWELLEMHRMLDDSAECWEDGVEDRSKEDGAKRPSDWPQGRKDMKMGISTSRGPVCSQWIFQTRGERQSM